LVGEQAALPIIVKKTASRLYKADSRLEGVRLSGISESIEQGLAAMTMIFKKLGQSPRETGSKCMDICRGFFLHLKEKGNYI